jgi:ABC-type lipoprotein export system ATPase subunit
MQVEIQSVEFAYGDDGFHLSIPEMEIQSGERVAFVGPSGSGKTTLLRLLAGIATPQSGRVTVGDFLINQIKDAERRAFRISQIGFVFQDFRLVDYLDVRGNILLPHRLNSTLNLNENVENRLNKLAETLQLLDKLNSPVDELSQGEKQRTAIARALLPKPGLILADEPTGNLDPGNKRRILDLLFEQAKENDATLVMVTHDHALLGRFDRVIDFAQFHALETIHA